MPFIIASCTSILVSISFPSIDKKMLNLLAFWYSGRLIRVLAAFSAMYQSVLGIQVVDFDHSDIELGCPHEIIASVDPKSSYVVPSLLPAHLPCFHLPYQISMYTVAVCETTQCLLVKLSMASQNPLASSSTSQCTVHETSMLQDNTTRSPSTSSTYK